MLMIGRCSLQGGFSRKQKKPHEVKQKHGDKEKVVEGVVRVCVKTGNHIILPSNGACSRAPTYLSVAGPCCFSPSKVMQCDCTFEGNRSIQCIQKALCVQSMNPI